MRSVKVKAELRLNAYAIIADAVERGLSYGWMRAHKYVDKPDEEAIKDAMHDAVMNEIAELMEYE